MSKNKPFFPTLNTRGFIQTGQVVSFNNGQEYIAGRDKEALLFPNKVRDYSKQFHPSKTCDGSYFTTPVG